MSGDGPGRVRLGGDLFHPVVPAGAVRITRPTRWGNPFPVGRYGLVRALALHRGWLLGAPDAVAEARAIGCRLRLHGPALVDAVRRELAGRVLACWCPLDGPCHGDLLLAVAGTGRDDPVPALPRAGRGSAVEPGDRAAQGPPPTGVPWW